MESSIQRLSSRVPAHGRDARVERERRSKQRGSQSFELDEEESPSRDANVAAPRPAAAAEPSAKAHEDGLGESIDLIA